ncbi:MAG: hypoxanthine-guanine phosphoribosyltransferase [Pseudomonadota bacterium]
MTDTTGLPAGADCIHDAAAVTGALQRMSEEINERIAPGVPARLLTIMNGGMLTAGRLAPLLHSDLTFDYLHATRYHAEKGAETVRWHARPRDSLKDQTVLLVDDILDEGYTLKVVQQFVREAGARSVLTAVLAEKLHDRRAAGVSADVIGLTVPDVYVFGMGMDFRGRLRQLDAIYGLPA